MTIYVSPQLQTSTVCRSERQYVFDFPFAVVYCSSGEPSTRFKTFMNNVVKSGSLAEKYNAVRHESDSMVGAGDIMDMS